MSERLYPHDDFEVLIRIYAEHEGGRRNPPHNGIRWDFAYAADPPAQTIYMIWPDFVGSDGCSLPTDLPLRAGKELDARMYVAVEEMRQKIHRTRVRPGVRFFCHEGARRVAEGIVIRITGLFDSR